jgi:hypothetical protein
MRYLQAVQHYRPNVDLRFLLVLAKKDTVPRK